jgi:hypothetical protein
MLNLELQGKDKHFAELISSVRAFRAKLTLWISDIKDKTLLHFPHLKKVMSEAEENFEPLPFVGHLENLNEEFQRRFQEFSSTETEIKFVVNPFNAVDVSETATLIANPFQADVRELGLEIINIQSDIVLQSYSKEKNFWKLVDGMKHPILRGTALGINSCFGSTYLRRHYFQA